MKNNRRKNQRRMCIVPVDGQEGGLFDKTRTVDLSQGGLGFLSHKNIPLSQEITIELDLGVRGTTVLTKGIVRWVQHLTQPNLYRIGLSFSEFLRGSKDQLQRYFQK